MEGKLHRNVINSRFDSVALALARVMADEDAQPCSGIACEFCTAHCNDEREFLTVDDVEESAFYGVHGMGLCK